MFLYVSELMAKYSGVPFLPYILFDVVDGVEESTGIG